MNAFHLATKKLKRNINVFHSLSIILVILFLSGKLQAQIKDAKITITIGPEFTIEKGESSVRQFAFIEVFNKNVFVTFKQDNVDYSNESLPDFLNIAIANPGYY